MHNRAIGGSRARTTDTPIHSSVSGEIFLFLCASYRAFEHEDVFPSLDFDLHSQEPRDLELFLFPTVNAPFVPIPGVVSLSAIPCSHTI